MKGRKKLKHLFSLIPFVIISCSNITGIETTDEFMARLDKEVPKEYYLYSPDKLNWQYGYRPIGRDRNYIDYVELVVYTKDETYVSFKFSKRMIDSLMRSKDTNYAIFGNTLYKIYSKSTIEENKTEHRLMLL